MKRAVRGELCTFDEHGVFEIQDESLLERIGAGTDGGGSPDGPFDVKINAVCKNGNCVNQQCNNGNCIGGGVNNVCV